MKIVEQFKNNIIDSDFVNRFEFDIEITEDNEGHKYVPLHIVKAYLKNGTVRELGTYWDGDEARWAMQTLIEKLKTSDSIYEMP